MFDSLMAFRKLMAATFLMFAAAIPATTAGAQQIVVIVNGEPITAVRITHPGRLYDLIARFTPTCRNSTCWSMAGPRARFCRA